MQIPKIDLRELNLDIFQQNFVQANQPVIIQNVLGPNAIVNEQWSLSNTVALLGDMSLRMRCYGPEHTTQPNKWSQAGYCAQEKQVSAQQYAELIINGSAHAEDLYVVCDVAQSLFGRMLQTAFTAVGQKLGLRLSNFGPTITIWWGPVGHTEGLHCDITDGTLWQLSGQKQVILFPDYCWKSLAPFPFGGKMSWAFSQVNVDHPDFEQFPQLNAIWDKKIKVILSPGEILYLPALWAHHIRGIAGQHVLSVNRFWRTSMDKMRYLPQDVLEGLGISV